MNTIPVELGIAIAAQLRSSVDMGSFRLTCKSFSIIGLPLQAQHIAVLDSFESLIRLDSFLKENRLFAQYTIRLTVYHAAWRIYPRDIGEADEENDAELFYPLEEHQKLIRTEARRHLHSDATLMIRLLCMVPRLKSLLIAPIPTWKLRRHERLSIHPFSRDSAGMTCSRIFPVLRSFPLIQELEVRGRVSPRELSWNTLEHVQKLSVHSLILSLATRNSMASFLQRFPSLHELCLGAAEGMHGLILFNGISLLDLRYVELKGVWITIEMFEALLRQHPSLHNVVAVDVTLSTGTWDKLLRIADKCYPHVNILFQDCRLNPYRYQTPRFYSCI